jgi:2,4-dienoyl-CoA reductase-like NADH-dependent reductase (Old Yellow Enzyme family)
VGLEMPDEPRFDYHRYRLLLAEAVDEKKRRALIDVLIEERAKDRLTAQRAYEQKAVTMATVARVLRTTPDLAESAGSTNSADLTTSQLHLVVPIKHRENEIQ